MGLGQLNTIIQKERVKVIFTDYFDTLFHRTVHPNQVQRIWAKLLINELGLDLTIDELYFIRQQVTEYLAENLKKSSVEIPYAMLQKEVCNRLLTHNLLHPEKEDLFIAMFEEGDIKAELSVQYANNDVISFLKAFKANGGKIHLISDFYGSVNLFRKMLNAHGILELFDTIFSSSSLEKSKQNGSVYQDILSITNTKADEALMIGDNAISDGINAKKNGIKSYVLPHKKYHRKNKRNNLGNDKKHFNKVLKRTYYRCKKEALPYTEYVMFYHLFIEQLYKRCRKDNITNLFFLAREGLYLKKLFESYQNHHILESNYKVKVHYLRMSRQSSLQIALKDINEEPFTYLKNNFDALSIVDFLNTFGFTESEISDIVSKLKNDASIRHTALFSSESFKELKSNVSFLKLYDNHRISHANAFKAYIESFGVDIYKEGINLVDVGWGGTMQESIHKFFENRVPVTGYYLGLKEIYNITPQTKRFGLNFTVFPYISYEDYILMANTQLYEQFMAANHGCAVGYDLNATHYTIEYHQPKEKWLYDNYIQTHQKMMFSIHQSLLKSLQIVCYDNRIIKRGLSNLALKVGLLQNHKKLTFLHTLANGFYQNIGDNQIGVEYTPPKIKSIRKKAINFLMRPEYYFRYLVKVKSAVHRKNRLIAFFIPTYLFYWYFLFNRYLRFRVLHKTFLLKYNFFK